MGVWQVTNETQQYVAQWDLSENMYWNGFNWEPLLKFVCGKSLENQRVITSMPQAEAIKHWEKETQPKAQDPWEALKSMF